VQSGTPEPGCGGETPGTPIVSPSCEPFL
jgi:hypothetical protein